MKLCRVDWSGPLTADPSAGDLLAWAIPQAGIPTTAGVVAVAVPGVAAVVQRMIDVERAWLTLAAVSGPEFDLSMIAAVQCRGGVGWRSNVDAIESVYRDYIRDPRTEHL